MAERIGRAVLELGADPSGLFRTYEQAKAGARSTDAEFERLRQRSRQLGADLESTVRRFEGRKLVDEARTAAKAIEQLGGVGKLTKRELDDVARTVNAATDKLTRMGDEVPPSLRRLKAEIDAVSQTSGKAATGGIGSLSGAFATLRGQIPLLTAAGAVGLTAKLATDAMQAADEIVKVSSSLEISIGKVQEWQYVAGQTSTTIDAFAGNANKLSLNVAGGSQKVRDAIKDLGLSYSELRTLKPEALFDRVVEALEGVDDVTTRNTLGTALFGKKFTEISVAVTEGYTRMRQEAAKASDEQVRAAEAAGDAWEKFKGRIGALSIGVVGRLAQELQDSPIDLDRLTQEQLDYYHTLMRAGGDAYGYLLQLERERVRGMHDIALGSAAATAATTDYTASLRAARDEVAKFVKDQEKRAQLDAAIALGGDAAQEYADSIGLSSDALRLYTQQAQKGTKAGTDLADVQRALFGQEVIARGEQYAKALGDVANLAKLTTDKKAELRTAVVAAIAAYEQLGQKAPASLQAIELATRPVLESTMRLQSVLPQAAQSAEEAARKVGASLRDLPSSSSHETAEATREADAAMQAWANTTGGAYPAAVSQARAATDELADSTVDAYSALAEMFAQLGQLGGGGSGGLGSTMRSIGSVVIGLHAAQQQSRATNSEGIALGGRFGTLSTVFSKNATSSQKMAAGLASAAGVASGAAAIWSATGQSASKMQNALSGAMAGAQAGAMFGPWGVAIGAAAGLVVGLVRGKPAWAQAAKEVGRDFGVEISKELGQKIADLAKKEYKGNRQAAAVASLADIIKEAGGLNAANLGQMTARLRDVFALFEAKQMTAAQATKVLDENFAAFVQAGTDGMGHLSEGLKEIIRLQQRMGIESQAVTQYLKEQASVAIGGANAVIAASASKFDQWQKVADAAKAAAKARADALADGSASASDPDGSRGDKLQGLDKDLAAANAALAAQRANAQQYKQELDDLSLIAAGSYYAAIKAGKSHAEAMREAGPGLAQLKAAYDNLGLSVEDAGTRSLMLQADLQQRAPQLLAGVDGLTASFVALDNMGRMNADTFAAMQRRGMELFTRIQGELKAAGADMSTNVEALIPMQAYLREAARQAEALGIPLDENTQSLIDQSKELGLWKDEGDKGASTVQEGLQDVVDVLKDIKDALLGIPPVVRTKIITDREDGTSGSGRDGERNHTYAEGVFRGRFSAGGTQALLHNVESVVPRDKELEFVSRVLGELAPSSSSVTTTSQTVAPLAVFYPDRSGQVDGSAINRHLASVSGILSNEFGLREVIEAIASTAARKELRRA